MAAGADMDAKVGPQQRTPIDYAAMGGHLPIVRILIKAGAGREGGVTCGLSPLVAAVRGGHVKTVEFLLEAGAPVNDVWPKTGESPLLTAVLAGNVKLVNCLLAAGANPSLPAGDEGLSVLQTAKNMQLSAIIKKLEAAASR